jgi:hypothetical protein
MQEARTRGVSLSAMPTALARQAERSAAVVAEREASRADADDFSVRAEERDFEVALRDEVD